MDKTTKAKLEKAGWKVGSTQEFLELSDADMALIEMKISAADGLRSKREELNLTQTQLANLIGSSQSRVAKMEAADPTVSLDLLVRALLRLGTTKSQLGKLLSRRLAPSS
jgi:DNA-binding XRE family transcriptional regulator